MILTTEIKIKIQGRNIHYYESLGYNTIPIEHLPKTSHEKILVKCDNCGNEKYCQNIAYNRYLSNSKDNEYTDRKTANIMVKILKDYDININKRDIPQF